MGLGERNGVWGDGRGELRPGMEEVCEGTVNPSQGPGLNKSQKLLKEWIN